MAGHLHGAQERQNLQTKASKEESNAGLLPVLGAVSREG